MKKADCELWRELALQHLHGDRAIITSASSHADLWWCFKELLCDAGSGRPVDKGIEAIFRYAWWCVNDSGDEQLVAEVQTYFYEDLPVYDELAAQVPLYITPQQFERLEPVFRYRLTENEYAEFRCRYCTDRERIFGIQNSTEGQERKPPTDASEPSNRK
jgi:hypothetical protein